MANLKVQKALKMIDETSSKGSSRVYKRNSIAQEKLAFMKISGNKELVLKYIFEDGEYPEELKTLTESDKEPCIADNGLYIYNEDEIEKYGVPAGKYYLKKEGELIEQGK